MSSSEVSAQMQDLQLYEFKTAIGQGTMCLIWALAQHAGIVMASQPAERLPQETKYLEDTPQE